MSELDVIEQKVEYIEDARNCACCRFFNQYAVHIMHKNHWIRSECLFEGGPIWSAYRERGQHPNLPGRTVCNLWESDQLL